MPASWWARGMPRRSVPKRWPRGLIEAARKLNVGGYYTQWANPERLPLLVERLYMEFEGEM